MTTIEPFCIESLLCTRRSAEANLMIDAMSIHGLTRKLLAKMMANGDAWLAPN